jgi:hypothetical protein
MMIPIFFLSATLLSPFLILSSRVTVQANH